MRRVKRRENGVALVLTLWLLTLLAILAAAYGYAMRTETNLTIHGVEQARGRASAEAGVWLALADLLKPERQWRSDGAIYQLDFGAQQIRLRVQDEAGRIDLNSAHDILLRGLLEKAAEPGDDVDYMLNAILDWRDPDKLRRNPGAEDDDYAHAGYGAKDAPFHSIEELRLVAGITRDIFARIYPALTVHSGQPRIHPLLAPREVLLALPGADEKQVDAFIRNRRNRDTPAIPPAGMDSRFFGGAGGTAFNITSAGIAGRSKLKLDVVITLNNDSRLPYSVLSWRESKPEYNVAQAAEDDHGTLSGES